ncbi:MAG: hypothetical protein ACSHYB_17865, partial [Roseibacillus sp.]
MMKTNWRAILIGMLSLGLSAIQARAVEQFYQVDSQSSFYNIVSNSPLVVELASLEISPGDVISLTKKGSYDGGGSVGVRGRLRAVFSASNQLLPIGNDHRVVDAIEAGDDVVSFAPDIPEDFSLLGVNHADDFTLQIEVPAMAGYLFFGVGDSNFGDNSDPDGDFGVTISSNSCETFEYPEFITREYSVFSSSESDPGQPYQEFITREYSVFSSSESDPAQPYQEFITREYSV